MVVNKFSIKYLVKKIIGHYVCHRTDMNDIASVYKNDFFVAELNENGTNKGVVGIHLGMRVKVPSYTCFRETLLGIVL